MCEPRQVRPKRSWESIPQPLHLNTEPSSLNPQPSALSPQPSTLNPQPSILKVPVDTCCCYNPALDEIWVLDPDEKLSFLVCDSMGHKTREVRPPDAGLG